VRWQKNKYLKFKITGNVWRLGGRFNAAKPLL